MSNEKPSWPRVWRVVRRVVGIILGLAFFVVVFFVIPAELRELNAAWGWPRWEAPGGRILGGLAMAGALALFAYCTGLFAWVGRGTPVPIDPPRHLVVKGPYRFTRNPLYMGYIGFILGEFLYFGDVLLLLYAAGAWAFFHAVVVWHEELLLRKRFGEEFDRYMEEVPRWLPWRKAD